MYLKFKVEMVAVSWIWGFLQFFCIEVYRGIWLYVLFALEVSVAIFQIAFLLKSQTPGFYESEAERNAFMVMGPGLYMIFMVYVPNLPLAVKAAPIILFAYAAALAYLTLRNRKDYFYYVYLGICTALLITCFTDSYAEFHGEVYEGF